MTDQLSPDFRPRFTDSVSRLTSLSRLFVSRALREDGPDLSRGVDALSRAMFRKASSPALPLSERLRLLASLHGLLNGTTYIVDRRREERWDTLAGEVVEAAFPRARAGEEDVLVPLCLCLADYFYFDPCPESDDWYLFLKSTVDRFGESLSPSGEWPGLCLADALRRIELMNRHSYMFLYHRWDAAIGTAFRHYSAEARKSPTLSPSTRELLRELKAEGNAVEREI